MIKKLLYPKLLESESLRIRTDYTKKKAIAHLTKATVGRMSVNNIGSHFMREDPIFRGKIESDGFEIQLFQSMSGNPFSPFSPPTIKGVWQGEEKVEIQTTIEFSKYQKLITKFDSLFGRVALILIIFIPQIGLGTAYYEIQNSGGEVALENYLMKAMIFLSLSLLVCLISQMVFYSSTVSLMNRSMKRSKELIANFFNP